MTEIIFQSSSFVYRDDRSPAVGFFFIALVSLRMLLLRFLPFLLIIRTLCLYILRIIGYSFVVDISQPPWESS